MVFDPSSYSYLLEINLNFLFKIENSYCFCPNEPDLVKFEQKLWTLKHTSKYTKSNRHPVWSSGFILKLTIFTSKTRQNLSKKKKIKQNHTSPLSSCYHSSIIKALHFSRKLSSFQINACYDAFSSLEQKAALFSFCKGYVP